MKKIKQRLELHKSNTRAIGCWWERNSLYTAYVQEFQDVHKEVCQRLYKIASYYWEVCSLYFIADRPGTSCALTRETTEPLKQLWPPRATRKQGLPNSNTLLTTPQPYWWQHARTTNKHFQPHTWIHKLPGNTKITEGTSKILNRFTIEANGLQEQSWPPQANRKQGSPNSNNSSQTTTSLVTTWTTNKHFQPQTWIQKPPWNTRITERTSKIVDRFTIGRN